MPEFWPTYRQHRCYDSGVVVTGTLGLVIPAWIRGKAPKHFATVATLLAFVIAISTAGTLLLALLFPDRFSIGLGFGQWLLIRQSCFGQRAMPCACQAWRRNHFVARATPRRKAFSVLRRFRSEALTLTGDISATDRTTIVVHTLKLENTRLHLASHDLKIEVLDLVISGRVRIVAHPNKSPNADKDGANGGNVQIIVHRKIVGQIDVDISGTAGADGEPGGQGPAGTHGRNGDNAVSRLFEALAAPGEAEMAVRGSRARTVNQVKKTATVGLLCLQSPMSKLPGRRYASLPSVAWRDRWTWGCGGTGGTRWPGRIAARRLSGGRATRVGGTGWPQRLLGRERRSGRFREIFC